MKFKGHITALGATVSNIENDVTRKITLRLHEEGPAAFASLDYLLGKTVVVDVNLEQPELDPLGREKPE
jgi:hypothetical protein